MSKLTLTWRHQYHLKSPSRKKCWFIVLFYPNLAGWNLPKNSGKPEYAYFQTINNFPIYLSAMSLRENCHMAKIVHIVSSLNFLTNVFLFNIFFAKKNKQNNIFWNTKHYIIYLFCLYWDILPLHSLNLAFKGREILQNFLSNEIFGYSYILCHGGRASPFSLRKSQYLGCFSMN